MSNFLGRLLALLTVWRLSRTDEHEPEAEHGSADHGDLPALEDPSERTVPSSPRAETIVAVLLGVAAAGGLGFTAVYVLDGHSNQLLGLAIGCMFVALAAAAIVAGLHVVPQETSVEERDSLLEEGEPAEIAEMIKEGGEGISRRVLLTGAAGITGVGLTTVVGSAIASIGPRMTGIHKSPWHHGVPIVDDTGRIYRADDIQIGSFYTGLPAGAYWEQLAAPLLLVRLPRRYIHLPRTRPPDTWAPQGIMAFSKICTHAGCAISLYRYPTFAPTSVTNPAFTCPCHYSTFLPGYGGTVIFGPAGRPLPQLPVMIRPNGQLAARGNFNQDVGPAWFGTRIPKDFGTNP